MLYISVDKTSVVHALAFGLAEFLNGLLELFIDQDVSSGCFLLDQLDLVILGLKDLAKC